MFGPVSSHLLSIVPGSVGNNFSGPAQFPNQHPTEKPWLWSSWLSNLCRAKTSNTVNHSVPPEVTPGDGGQASDFLQPLPWGRNCFPCLSVPRQTSLQHHTKPKPSPRAPTCPSWGGCPAITLLCRGTAHTQPLPHTNGLTSQPFVQTEGKINEGENNYLQTLQLLSRRYPCLCGYRV